MPVPGTNPLRGPRSSFVDGVFSGNLPLGQCIGGEEVLMGRRFWVGCVWFFSGRGGVVKRKRPSQGTFNRVGFCWTTRVFKQPHFLCDTLHILKSSGSFVGSCLQTITNGAPDPCTSFRDFRHGLHGAVGMVSYAHVVYVTCYFCYMFSLRSSSGSTGSVRIYRSSYEHYTPNILLNIYRCIPT